MCMICFTEALSAAPAIQVCIQHLWILYIYIPDFFCFISIDEKNFFILSSCIVNMFSTFTAPEIYWRKDGWVQESHLDFHFVQYARYNIMLH